MSNDLKSGVGTNVGGCAQCTIGNGRICIPCKQTDTSENITFPQHSWRAVTIKNLTVE